MHHQLFIAGECVGGLDGLTIEVLDPFAAAIRSMTEEFTRIESLDTRHPIRDARTLDVARTPPASATSVAVTTRCRVTSSLPSPPS